MKDTEFLEDVNKDIRWFKNYLYNLKKNYPQETPRSFNYIFGYNITIIGEGEGFIFEDDNEDRSVVE